MRIKNLIIEFIGTFFLVLTIGLSANPVAIGAVLAAMVYLGGYISGAHYNPAVTLAVWLRGKIRAREAGWYVLTQMVAAILAAAVYFVLKGSVMVVAPHTGFSFAADLLAEIIFTFALVSVILHTAVSQKTQGNQYYGIAIGFTLLVGAYSVGSISGGAFNPAVGLGPALFDFSSLGRHLSNLGLYLLGPLAGASLAAVIFGATVDDKV